MNDNSIYVWISIVVLVLMSAFFSSTETAFSSLSRAKIKYMSENGNRRAKMVMKLIEEYDKILSTILIGNNLVNIGITAVATMWFVKQFGDIGASMSTAVITVIVLIFGEISPKSLAKESPEKLAMFSVPVISVLIVIFAPLNKLFGWWKILFLKLLNVDNDRKVTEGELLTLVDEAQEDGGIDHEDKIFINNIFKFDDLTAGEISTHRTKIYILWLNESVEQWEQTIYNSRHSVYPVCDEIVDNIIGILDAKDYFRLKNKDKENIVKNIIKPAYFVPENIKADVLFKNMKKSRNNFSVVLDEYGGVRGIVTIYDLVQQLVGDIEYDEKHDVESPSIERLDSNVWSISGNISLEKVQEKLCFNFPWDEYETLSGLVFGTMGEVPKDGSKFKFKIEGLTIDVIEIKNHRIEKAILSIDKNMDIE